MIKKHLHKECEYMYKTILFDVDGTLIDTENAIIKSFQKTLLETKNLTVPKEDLYYVLGIPGTKAVEKYCDNKQDGQLLLAAWGKNMALFYRESKLFPNTKETLKTLFDQGFKLGVITSKTDHEMVKEFDDYGLNEFFDIIVTASDTKLHKPNPDPILKALELLGIKKDEAIYIGDSVYDMNSAHSAGINFGLAKWGAKDNPEFEQAEHFYNDISDLIN